MTTPLSAAQLERLHRDAKKLARKKSIRLCEAQQELANQRGYPNWSMLVQASKGSQVIQQKLGRRALATLSLRRYGDDQLFAALQAQLGHLHHSATYTYTYLRDSSERPAKSVDASNHAGLDEVIAAVDRPRSTNAGSTAAALNHLSLPTRAEQEISQLLGHVSSNVTRQYRRPRRAQKDAS